MNTFEMIDPALRPLAKMFAAFDPSRQPIVEYRADLDALFPIDATKPPLYVRETISPEGDGDALQVLLYRPETPPEGLLPAILFLHGSGFISGSAEIFADGNHALAQKHNALVVTVKYRLAPESVFPAPLQDAYAGLKWLFDNAVELGVDPKRIVVMGESAGGGLAAMLMLLARDRGEYSPSGQVLIYPMLDPRTGTQEAPVDNPAAGEHFWTVRHNQFAWQALRGESEIAEDWLPYFAPALFSDVTGMPPTFIAVGALDLFLEEDVAYALRLSRAGAAVEMHVYPGGIHGFDFVPCAISSQYQADREVALNRMLGATVDSVD